MQRNESSAVSLTTYDVAPDGSHARLHMLDSAGEPVTLVLPESCLNQLLMSVPTMIKTALRRSHPDNSMRLAHPLEAFELEYGEFGDNGESRFILSLHTIGGFEVSFSVHPNNLAHLANSILKESPQHLLQSRGTRLPS
jgi:hypothetical protein